MILQSIPKTCVYDANATPPQFTDHEGLTIEPGTHIRLKLIGIRTEVTEMWAVGTINEDYLGYFYPTTPSPFNFLGFEECLLIQRIVLWRSKTHVRARRKFGGQDNLNSVRIKPASANALPRILEPKGRMNLPGPRIFGRSSAELSNQTKRPRSTPGMMVALHIRFL